MFGIKRKRKSNFLTVFSKLYKLKNKFVGETLQGWGVYPDAKREGRVEINLYLGNKTLIINSSDCDMEIDFIAED